jgi:hypothetical protein
MSTLSEWRPYQYKVDSSAIQEGRFVSGAFTMLAAGPPRLSSIGGYLAAGLDLGMEQANTQSSTNDANQNWALPIGVVQNFNLSQNRNLARFWELGSERSYFISGRTVAQIGFGRVLYHGPSLLRVLYSFYNDLVPPTVIQSFGLRQGLMRGVANPHDVKLPPGFENLYLNLASDLFSQPCGMLIYMKDSNEMTVGMVYAEESYIPAHSLATDAQGCVVQEQVSLQPERLVPVACAQVALTEFAENPLAF